VRELHALEDNYKQIQAENYSLREYIIHLQSRLIDSGDQQVPPPPPNVNLEQHQQRHAAMEQQMHDRDGAPVAPMAPMSQLQASAARALASANKHAQEEHGYAQGEQQSDENIIRKLVTGGLGS